MHKDMRVLYKKRKFDEKEQKSNRKKNEHFVKIICFVNKMKNYSFLL